MDSTILDQEYDAVKRTVSFSQHNKFIKQLLSSDDPEVLHYHYKLLKDRDNRRLYHRIRAAFIKRGQVAEMFLLNVIDYEKDQEMQGDILHILGRLRSKEAALLAREFVVHQDLDHREKACYVLGWVGTEDDIMILGDCLLNDPDLHVRGTAATAHTQVWLRLPETKNRHLANLKKALIKEQNEEVIARIIITVQYIMEKKFGMRENIEEGEISGDVDRAKIKTLKALETLNLD